LTSLVAGIYVFTTVPLAKAWMAGTSQDKPGHDDVDQPQHLFSDEFLSQM
jgi:hypothetical protein